MVRLSVPMRFVTAPLLLVLCLLLAGCTPSSPPQPLRIDGSTGVHALVTELAAAYERAHPGRPMQVRQGLTPTERLDALAAGHIDLAMASHGLDAEALTSRSLTPHRFARTAVVMAVHQSVPLESLTAADLCALYAGTVTSWQELGGPDLPVAPRLRPFTEVDGEVVAEYAPCLLTLTLAETVVLHPRSGPMARDLAETPGSIGMTTETRVEQSQGALRTVAIDGLLPSDDAYPLWRDAYLVATSTPSPAVQHFLDYVQSEPAADVLQANGAEPARP